MNQKELVAFICAQVLKEHEGMRFTPYNDSLGHCTVGVGHLLHKGSCTKDELSSLYSKSQIAGFLDRDVEVAYKDAVIKVSENKDPYASICSVIKLYEGTAISARARRVIHSTAKRVLDLLYKNEPVETFSHKNPSTRSLEQTRRNAA